MFISASLLSLSLSYMVAIQEDFEDPHIVDEDDLGNDDEIIDIYKHSC